MYAAFIHTIICVSSFVKPTPYCLLLIVSFLSNSLSRCGLPLNTSANGCNSVFIVAIYERLTIVQDIATLQISNAVPDVKRGYSESFNQQSDATGGTGLRQDWFVHECAYGKRWESRGRGGQANPGHY